VQQKKWIQALIGERQLSFHFSATPKPSVNGKSGRERIGRTVESTNGRAEIGTLMRQLEGPSGFRAEQGQRSQQVLPEHRLAEALKQLYTLPGFLTEERAGILPAALQTICRLVKQACAVEKVQLWLIETDVEQRSGGHWLKRWACSEGCTEYSGPAKINLTTDLIIARLLFEGRSSSLYTVTNDAAGSLALARFPEATTVLLVPLMTRGEPLGMLALGYGSPGERFSVETISLAELLADHVAQAVQNIQQFVALQERALAYERGLSAVRRAAEAITSTLTLSEVAEQIVSVISSALKAQAVWIMIYDEEAYRLRVEAVVGWDAIRGTEIVPEKSVIGEILSTGRPVFVPDVQSDPRFAVKLAAAQAGIVAMLGLPLVVQGRVMGMLGVNPAPDADGVMRNPLDGPDGEWLRLFANQGSVAIQNAQLYESLQAERALAEQWASASQRHAGEMETIFESMAEGVAVFDTSGQLVRLNRAGAVLIGLSAARLLLPSATALGTGISETVASKEFVLIRHPLVLRALGGEVVTDEGLTITRADGASVALQVSVAPLYDKAGQVTGAVAIMEDVTERQEYQREQLAVGWVAAALNHPLDLKETLDTAVEALTAALGADDSAIMLVDEAKGVLRVASERGYGVGKCFPDLPLDAPLNPSLAFNTRKVRVYNDESLGDHPLHEALKQSGLKAGLAVPLLVQDQALGVLVYSYTRQHHFSAGEQQVARAIADQIALAVLNARLYEEVADYAAAQEHERRTLQAVIDALPAGVILRNKDGNPFIYNEAALKLAYNYAEVQEAFEAGQTPVQPVWEISDQDGTLLDLNAFPSQRVLQTGEPVEALHLFVHQRDGRAVPVLLNAVPLQDTEGHYTRGLAVFQDITALKELERHKDEFISVASHELRGPLTVIRGQTQLLQRQLRRQEKHGEMLPGLPYIMESMESIEAQTARLNDLVNDLLDVSRIQAGKLNLQRATVPLTPLVTKAIQHWKPTSERHQLMLETNLPTEDVQGYWDMRRVEQILNNLIGNAIKYSPEGGKVDVQVQVEGQEQHHVLIRVRDEGMGIPPEALPHLFERFYRAGNVSSIGGTGLGLYISQQLAVAHGGDLWAESAGLAKGSTFSLRLPLQ
jgi:PAS domain S-box-containing protein